MNQVHWGILSALSLGTADFVARFSSRSIGHTRALLGMLLVSSILVCAYAVGTGVPVFRLEAVTWPIILHGVFLSGAMSALYAALAIGPIKIAAPLVASHPMIVVLWALANGSRPTFLQAIGLGVTIIGVILIGRPRNGKERGDSGSAGIGEHKSVVAIALLASLLYAFMLIAGQEAARTSGVLTTLCLGRVIAFAVLAVFVAIQSDRLSLPCRWWPVLVLQGALDTAGVLFLLLGSFGPHREITVVVSATFGAVTVLLAWIVLKEKLSLAQWTAAILIFAGAACLASAA